MKDKSQLYAGIIWVVSAIALLVYGFLLFNDSQIPGMSDLITFLSGIDTKYIYLSAFVSVFIEGLYFIGSFFPGASLVMVITIISGTNGYSVFLITLSLIFIGWSMAGMVNIYLAKIYRNKIIKLNHSEDYHVNDRIWTTWFPSFRSSYEVAQIIEGGHPLKVFISSLRVRLLAILLLGGLSLIIPLVFDVKETSEGDNFTVIAVVFIISLVVGIVKIKKYYSLS